MLLSHRARLRTDGGPTVAIDDPRSVLFLALCALRASSTIDAPGLAPHWRTVDRWLRDRARKRDPGHEDVHQETMIAVARGVRSMQAATPVAAAAWLRSVLVHKRSDVRRCVRRDRMVSDHVKPVDAYPAPDVPPAVSPDTVIDALEADVARHLLRTVRRAATRDRRRLQSRAALRRLVLGEDLDAITNALDLDVSPACVYKWTERGRAIVLAALDRPTDDALTEARELACLAMRERRSDAGHDRPERRAA